MAPLTVRRGTRKLTPLAVVCTLESSSTVQLPAVCQAACGARTCTLLIPLFAPRLFTLVLSPLWLAAQLKLKSGLERMRMCLPRAMASPVLLMDRGPSALSFSRWPLHRALHQSHTVAHVSLVIPLVRHHRKHRRSRIHSASRRVPRRRNRTVAHVSLVILPV